jgi:hypothetical protein
MTVVMSVPANVIVFRLLESSNRVRYGNGGMLRNR